MIGQKFGRLTVLKQAENDKWRNVRWLCQCTCGNLITVYDRFLKKGYTKSCGCLRREQWKGKDAGSHSTHEWLKRNKPKPEFCKRCKERPAEELSYNNIDKKGYSRNPEDYEWLCISCHRLKDHGNGVILTKARIHRIREFYTVGAAIQRELAVLFKVSNATIKNIINYQGAYQKFFSPNIFKDLVESLEGGK